MKIGQEKHNDIVVCFLEGEINSNNSPQLRLVFDAIIKKNEKKVLLDFSAVSYIDSSGLATLIEMFQRLKKIGGDLRLCNLGQRIKNIFEITKLHRLFAIFDTQELALENF
jgi:anti-anti-sigma factor